MGRFVETVFKFGMNVAAGLLLLTVLAIVFNSMLRYFFSSGSALILEFSAYVFLWVTFLGLAGTLLVDGHTKVDMLLEQVPESIRNVLERFIVPLGGLLYGSLIFYAGFQLTMSLFRRSTMSIGANPFPLWPIAIIIPIGSLLFMVAVVYCFFRDSRKG